MGFVRYTRIGTVEVLRQKKELRGAGQYIMVPVVEEVPCRETKAAVFCSQCESWDIRSENSDIGSFPIKAKYALAISLPCAAGFLLMTLAEGFLAGLMVLVIGGFIGLLVAGTHHEYLRTFRFQCNVCGNVFEYKGEIMHWNTRDGRDVKVSSIPIRLLHLPKGAIVFTNSNCKETQFINR